MQFDIRGLCVKAVDYAENDKILTIIAFGRGKTVASIKSVKSPKSKLKLSAMPLAYGEYSIFSKGQYNQVISASLEDNFFNCWNNFEKYAAAHIIIELLDKISYDNQIVDKELQLALKAISLINYSSILPMIFPTWYILKMFECTGIDLSDYELKPEVIGTLEALQSIDVESVDSFDITSLDINKNLQILSMILNNSLGLKLSSIAQINKSAIFEEQIKRNKKSNN